MVHLFNQKPFSANPILYSLLNTSFRKILLKKWRLNCCKKSDQNRNSDKMEEELATTVTRNNFSTLSLRSGINRTSSKYSERRLSAPPRTSTSRSTNTNSDTENNINGFTVNPTQTSGSISFPEIVYKRFLLKSTGSFTQIFFSACNYTTDRSPVCYTGE